MVKRIKYEYDADGIGVSRQVFRLPTADARVFLDTNNFKFKVVDITTGETIAEGGNSKKGNLHVLKRQVKKALERLGIQFGVEVRNVASKRTQDEQKETN